MNPNPIRVRTVRRLKEYIASTENTISFYQRELEKWNALLECAERGTPIDDRSVGICQRCGGRIITEGEGFVVIKCEDCDTEFYRGTS